jgi:hypothetical protein
MAKTLKPGLNKFAVTVEGVTSNGQTAKDIDELVFVIE